MQINTVATFRWMGICAARNMNEASQPYWFGGQNIYLNPYSCSIVIGLKCNEHANTIVLYEVRQA